MSDPLDLSVGQKFEIERMARAIDSTEDVQTLKNMAKQFFIAWMTQKAASTWILKNSLKPPYGI